MKTLIHVLSHNHPMFEYETFYELFANLGVPNNLTIHWFDNDSEILVKFQKLAQMLDRKGNNF
jgi:hypothetical protein